MDRNTVIDRIIAELYRQSNRKDNSVVIVKGRDPDTFHIMGILDVDRLAKAVIDA